MDPDSDSMNPDTGPDSMNRDTNAVSVNPVRMRIQWIRIWIRIQHFKWIRIRIQCIKDVQTTGEALLYTDLDRKSGYGSGLKIQLRTRTAKPDADTNPGTPLKGLPINGYHALYNIVIERIGIWSSILSKVYNIVTFSKPKNMLLLIFFPTFAVVPEKLSIKLAKKAVSTGKKSKKVWLNHILKNTLKFVFL